MTLLGYREETPAKAIFRFLMFIACLLIAFGLLVCGNPINAFRGLWKIYLTPGILITDYIEIGGLDGAFLNAGLAMLFSVLLMKFTKLEFSGETIGCSFIVAGFALFGKDIVNMTPIVLGTYFYSRFKGEEFKKYVKLALYSTCMGPMVTYVAVVNDDKSLLVRILFGLLTGVIIGFFVAPVAALTSGIHHGMLIFNTGFAAGLVGTMMVAVLKTFGWSFSSVMFWSTGNNDLLVVCTSVFLIFLMGSGFFLNGKSFKGLGNLCRHSDHMSRDFTELFGLPVTLMNMSVLGFAGMFCVLAMGGPLNGPTLGGVITLIGFAAFGMHVYNVLWCVIGIVLMSNFATWSLSDPSILLAVLFCACLCPISGKHGPIWGVIAGMLHVSIVSVAAVNHGWLNLYNNGFSAGIVCIILLPIIEIFEEKYKIEEEIIHYCKRLL